jgi:hypothetical protein
MNSFLFWACIVAFIVLIGFARSTFDFTNVRPHSTVKKIVMLALWIFVTAVAVFA